MQQTLKQQVLKKQYLSSGEMNRYTFEQYLEVLEQRKEAQAFNDQLRHNERLRTQAMSKIKLGKNLQDQFAKLKNAKPEIFQVKKDVREGILKEF